MGVLNISLCFMVVLFGVLQCHGVTSDTTALPQYPKCGIADEFAIPRMAGIYEPNKGQFPWMAALGSPSGSDHPDWKCSGTLITTQHVITTAYCAHLPDLTIARFGVIDIIRDNDHEDIKIVDKRIHPEYVVSKHLNDLAILKLEKPVSHDKVNPVCLPISEGLKAKTFVRYNPFVTGWGYSYPNTTKREDMLVASVTVRSRATCVRSFRDRGKVRVTEPNMCVGSTGRITQACDGFSGASLLSPWMDAETDEPTHLLIGVMTQSRSCANPRVPNVFVRVGGYSNWINSTVVTL